MRSPFEEFCVFVFVFARVVCIFGEILKNSGLNVQLCDSVLRTFPQNSRYFSRFIKKSLI